MRAPKQNCPRCNALQSFRPLHRAVRDKIIEVYIRCTVCRWEQVLRQSTSEIEHLMGNQRVLARRARREEDRHGVASNATRRLLTIVQTEMAERRREAGLDDLEATA